MSGPSKEEAPVRVCPHCSAQSRTNDDVCPHCGGSLIRDRRIRMRRRIAGMSKRQRRIVLGAAVVLLLAAVGGGIALKVNHDNDVRAKQEAEQAAAEQAQKQAQQQAAADKVERQLRELIVTELEDQVSKDAQDSVDQGILDGPVLRTECDPQGGAIDIAAATQPFSCLAVTTENPGGTIEGYRYTASVNYTDYSYTWRLGGDALP